MSPARAETSLAESERAALSAPRRLGSMLARVRLTPPKVGSRRRGPKAVRHRKSRSEVGRHRKSQQARCLPRQVPGPHCPHRGPHGQCGQRGLQPASVGAPRGLGKVISDGAGYRRIAAFRSRGENGAVADNDSAAGRQQNRRVEVMISNPPSAAR
jgi:hypothetical protein